MNNIHAKALTNAIKLLNAIGAKYAIVDSDGRTHGALPVNTKKKKAPLKYPYGSLANHIRPHLATCNVNQTISIPVGQFDLNAVYGSASSIASKDWGNGCHRISVSNDKKNVLITRTEKLDDLDDLFSQLGIQ